VSHDPFDFEHLEPRQLFAAAEPMLSVFQHPEIGAVFWTQHPEVFAAIQAAERAADPTGAAEASAVPATQKTPAASEPLPAQPLSVAQNPHIGVVFWSQHPDVFAAIQQSEKDAQAVFSDVLVSDSSAT
jgi:hypothetical protein